MRTVWYGSTFIVALAALTVVPLTAHSDTLRLKDGREIPGQYEGGSARVIRFRTQTGVSEYDLMSVAGVRISGVADFGGSSPGDESRLVRSFDREQERIIRAWFTNRSNLAGLPPGLARRESLPPGLARQVQRNGTLPPGLQRRLQPLPWDLESRLPGLWEGLERVVLGRDVLVIETRTATILDLLRDVF